MHKSQELKVQTLEGGSLKMLKKIIQTVLLLCLVVFLSSCGGSKEQKPSDTPGVITATDPQFQGVIKSFDSESGVAVFLDNNYGTDISLLISDSTSIYSVNNALTTMASLKPGMLVQAVYDGTSMMAKTIQPATGAWCYENIINWSIDSNSRIIEIAEKKYQFSSDIVILSGGKIQDIMSLNNMDELKVYGIDRKIYSIVVEKGHGYIRPDNFKDFIGGMASVGYIMNQPITEDMIMVVREGTYDVTMRNGDLVGTKTIDVRRDEETILDMIEFKQNPKDIGKVEFRISPLGADLYINGKQMDYSEPITLNYGEHEVIVSLMGYSTYSGKLKVSSPNPTVKINLTEEKAETYEATNAPASPTSASSSSAAPNFTASGASSTPSYTSTPTTQNSDESKIVYDKNHTITVNSPSGVEVYLNGVYKGITPCSFPKQIGSMTITLCKSGYVNKSYSVPIADDSQDVIWGFQELESE